jgi:hypothetical protein
MQHRRILVQAVKLVRYAANKYHVMAQSTGVPGLAAENLVLRDDAACCSTM